VSSLQDVCDLLVQIRDAILGQRAVDQVAEPVVDAVDGASGDQAALRIDSTACLASWNGHRLAINSHADFAVLSRLVTAEGALVPYIELERAIMPGLISDSIGAGRDTVAPQNAKDAVQHIRSALRRARCPLRVENVRQRGYRLFMPDE
jgi:hypothetical protein